MNVDESTPIIVGVGRYTRRVSKEDIKNDPLLLSPLNLGQAAIDRALADATISDTARSREFLHSLDQLVVIKSFLDTRTLIRGVPTLYENFASSIASKIGATPKQIALSEDGGNIPQYALNNAAEQISNGTMDTMLLMGAEAIYSFDKLMKTNKFYLRGEKGNTDGKIELPWGSADVNQYKVRQNTHVVGVPGNALGTETIHHRHGLATARRFYALAEQSYRHEQGKSKEEHLEDISELWHQFSKVAAKDENRMHSWFPAVRSAEEIRTPTKSNRMVSYPYTKYLNSVDQVDQSTAIVMMSVRKAREFNIPEEKWVFLHGCGDTTEIKNCLSREQLHRSPAMKLAHQKAMEMANLTMDDISLLDIYSCFPIAVETAATEIGLDIHGKQELTLTGGLASHGGPGNNYVSHSIAAMCENLRKKENVGKFGLVTANGGLFSKHSFGVYSTTPFLGKWKRENPKHYQDQLNAKTKIIPFAMEPSGSAVVETYTISFDYGKSPRIIVVGRLLEGKTRGSRFIANTDPADKSVLSFFQSGDRIGATGLVKSNKPGKFIFIPSAIQSGSLVAQL